MSWAASHAASALRGVRLPGWDATDFSNDLVKILVTGDFFGDGRRLVGLGGPDAALVDAVAQLHQVAFGQADMGILRSVAASTICAVLGAQAQVVNLVGQVGYGASEVEGVSLMAASIRSRAATRAWRPTCSWRVRKATL